MNNFTLNQKIKKLSKKFNKSLTIVEKDFQYNNSLLLNHTSLSPQQSEDFALDLLFKNYSEMLIEK